MGYLIFIDIEGVVNKTLRDNGFFMDEVIMKGK